MPLASTDITHRQEVDLLNERMLSLLEINPQQAAFECEKLVHLIENGSSGDREKVYSEGLAAAVHTQGRAHMQLANFGEALTCYLRALSLYESLHMTDQVVNCLSYIGVVYCYLSEYAQGMEYMFKALNAASEMGRELVEAEILNDLGYSFVMIGQYADALPYLEKSLEIFDRNGDKTRLSWTLDSLCNAYLRMGDPQHALEVGLESVRLSRELKEWKKVAEHMQGVGRAYLVGGDHDKAHSFFEESLIIAQQHGFRLEAGAALRVLGEMAFVEGESESALIKLNQALDIARAIEARELEIDCCRSLVNAHKSRKEYELALKYYEEFHTVKEAVFNDVADRRMKNLQVMHQLESARKETEIAHLRTLALQKEVDERKRAQEQLEHLANTDSLTGLTNRRSFFILAEGCFQQARLQGQPMALIMADIDHFKKVNDTYGHMTGDQVLVRLSDLVRASFRREDITSRFGGEEFVILLPNTDAAHARKVADRLRKQVMAAGLNTDQGSISITISLGVAMITDEPDLNLEDLLVRADRALYKAKQAGRNRVRIYQTEREKAAKSK